MNIKGAFADFRRGLSFIFSKTEAGEGDRNLAKVSAIVTAQIPYYGKDAVRTQVINAIESALKRKAKKGGKDAIDTMIEKALGTPEYMELLRKLGLEEAHLRVMALKALKERGIEWANY